MRRVDRFGLTVTRSEMKNRASDLVLFMLRKLTDSLQGLIEQLGHRPRIRAEFAGWKGPT